MISGKAIRRILIRTASSGSQISKIQFATRPNTIKNRFLGDSREGIFKKVTAPRGAATFLQYLALYSYFEWF